MVGMTSAIPTKVTMHPFRVFFVDDDILLV